MRFSAASAYLVASAVLGGVATVTMAQEQMIKMCLFYPSEAGHARSDPIINQVCPSDHVHTFYGPLNFHPDTTYQDLLNTPPEYSTSPFVENQSLYWHPTIYQVSEDSSGVKTYTRAPFLDTSPYYRWDKSAGPPTVAFPPEFRMIARSTDAGAQSGGETGGNMLVECCDMIGEEESCQEWPTFFFPKMNCDFLGIAFAMPTCWDESKGKGIDNGPLHSDHMAYTLDGTVAGECPPGFDKKVPQVQLFVRVINYRGAEFDYVLADEKADVWHVDFFNGWQENTLQAVINMCPLIREGADGYNPPCNCEHLLTPNTAAVLNPVCDIDVREHIVDEATDNINALPRGTCAGQPIINKNWDAIPPFDCAVTPMAPSTPRPTPAPAFPSPRPTRAPTNPTPRPTPAPIPEVTPEPEEPDTPELDGEGGVDGERGGSCEEECCFSDLGACQALVESLCGDESFIPDCEMDCEFMLEEDLIEEDELDECFDRCGDFQDRCFDQNEALCEFCEEGCDGEPCEVDCEEECCFEGFEACEGVVGFICEDEEECISEQEELICVPCE